MNQDNYNYIINNKNDEKMYDLWTDATLSLAKITQIE